MEALLKLFKGDCCAYSADTTTDGATDGAIGMGIVMPLIIGVMKTRRLALPACQDSTTCQKTRKSHGQAMPFVHDNTVREITTVQGWPLTPKHSTEAVNVSRADPAATADHGCTGLRPRTREARIDVII